MPLSFKVLKSVHLADAAPRELEVRHEFRQMDKLDDQDPAVQAQLDWARTQGARLIEEARGQAAGILSQAAVEKEQVKNEAYAQGMQEGYQDGYRQGLQAGQAVIDKINAQKQSELARLQETYARLFAESEQAMVTLSLEMARKIIGKQVELDPTVIVQVAKTVLREAHAGESYIVFVNPSDLQTAKDFSDELGMHIPAGATLQILPDADITQGGCRVETEVGSTDGTIEGQLAELRKILD